MMNKRELIYSIAEQTEGTPSAVRKVLNTFIDTVFNEVKSENKGEDRRAWSFFSRAPEVPPCS